MTELFAPRGESCVSERRGICKNWIKLYFPKVYTSVAAWRGRSNDMAEVGAMMWRRSEQ